MGTPAGTGFSGIRIGNPLYVFLTYTSRDGGWSEVHAGRGTRGRETKDSRCVKLPCNQSRTEEER